MLQSTLICSLVFALFPSVIRSDCKLNIDDLDEPQPVILTAYTHKFLYPTNISEEDRTVSLPQGQSILITCPGGHLNLDNLPSFVFGICNINDQLIVKEGPIIFSALRCDKVVTSHQITDLECAQKSTNKYVNIGFDVSITFVPIITICFDFLQRTPVFVNFTIPKAVGIARSALLEDFITDHEIYNLSKSIDEIYQEYYVSSVYSKLLGHEEDYFHNPYYREYLIRTNEFFYDSQQKALFRGIVSWPQWRGCYPSDELPNSVKRLVQERQIDVEIHAGALGISQMPHSKTLQPVEMYMYVDNIKAIPVPVLIWRLVYDPRSRRAIVLATIDNGQLLNAKDFVLCEENVSSNLTWVHWNGFDHCGISYACSYEEFKKKVPYLPEYDVAGILI